MTDENNSPENPTDFQKNQIFCGGISNIPEKDVSNYLEKFGSVLDITMIKNKATTSSRGFCFVTLDSNETYTRIIEIEHHEICGQVVQIKPALNKESSLSHLKSEKNRKIFIHNLPSDINQIILYRYFKQFGEIENIKIIGQGKEKSIRRNYCFITYCEKDDIEKVFEISYKHYLPELDMKVFVSRAMLRKDIYDKIEENLVKKKEKMKLGEEEQPIGSDLKISCAEGDEEEQGKQGSNKKVKEKKEEKIEEQKEKKKTIELKMDEKETNEGQQNNSSLKNDLTLPKTEATSVVYPNVIRATNNFDLQCYQNDFKPKVYNQKYVQKNNNYPHYGQKINKKGHCQAKISHYNKRNLVMNQDYYYYQQQQQQPMSYNNSFHGNYSKNMVQYEYSYPKEGFSDYKQQPVAYNNCNTINDNKSQYEYYYDHQYYNYNETYVGAENSLNGVYDQQSQYYDQGYSQQYSETKDFQGKGYYSNYSISNGVKYDPNWIYSKDERYVNQEQTFAYEKNENNCEIDILYQVNRELELEEYK